MDIIDRFRAAADHLAETEDAGPARLPIRLSKACVQVLPIIGAGLGLFSAPTMRIPIGASDDTATIAERLQFTVSDGPCFAAHRSGQVVVASADVIARSWPLFSDQLLGQTPIRGIVSSPLRDGLSATGVLDLYCDQSQDVGAVDIADVGVLAEHIAAELIQGEVFPSFRDGPLWDGPLWLNNPAVTARAYVLMAMGMIAVSLGMSLDGSLAVLQAHSFAASRTADATARDIVNRNLPVSYLSLDASI